MASATDGLVSPRAAVQPQVPVHVDLPELPHVDHEEGPMTRRDLVEPRPRNYTKILCNPQCWEYALEAIIKWFISIFMFMIIVYSPCYNCINRKHNTCVEI